MTVVDEPTSGGGSRPDVLRIVDTSDEKFCDAWGWELVGVEERGVSLLPDETECCGVAMEVAVLELEVVMGGKWVEGEGLLDIVYRNTSAGSSLSPGKKGEGCGVGGVSSRELSMTSSSNGI